MKLVGYPRVIVLRFSCEGDIRFLGGDLGIYCIYVYGVFCGDTIQFNR